MKERPLHPLQVLILKVLYKNKMTVYKLSKKLLKPTPLIQFHVRQLYNKKLILRKKLENQKGFVYYTNKKKVKIQKNKDKEIIYLVVT